MSCMLAVVLAAPSSSDRSSSLLLCLKVTKQKHHSYIGDSSTQLQACYQPLVQAADIGIACQAYCQLLVF
jgi:hypothetical protein